MSPRRGTPPSSLLHRDTGECWLSVEAPTFAYHEVAVKVMDDGTVNVTVGDQTITGVEKVTVDAYTSDPDPYFDPTVIVGPTPDCFTVTMTLRVKRNSPVGFVQVPAPVPEAEQTAL